MIICEYKDPNFETLVKYRFYSISCIMLNWKNKITVKTTKYKNINKFYKSTDKFEMANGRLLKYLTYIEKQFELNKRWRRHSWAWERGSNQKKPLFSTQCLLNSKGQKFTSCIAHSSFTVYSSINDTADDKFRKHIYRRLVEFPLLVWKLFWKFYRLESRLESSKKLLLFLSIGSYVFVAFLYTYFQK